MKRLLFLFIQLLATFQGVHLYFTDCSYDRNTSHVEYICKSAQGERFGRRNAKYLYCNNYPSEILRGSLLGLSFRECKCFQLDDTFGLYQFKSVRTFNISAMDIGILRGESFEKNGRMEHFIATHNKLERIPSNLFIHTPELVEIDLSYNKIEDLASEIFDNVPKLRTLQIAHNQIRELQSKLFANLVDLEVLDVSNNDLYKIESNLFTSNKKLRSLNLENSPFSHLQCDLLATLDSHSLNITFNTLTELKTNCANESKRLKINVTILSNESASSALRIADGKFDWVFTKNDFDNILYLNFSNSDMKHIPSLLQAATTKLISLDLSNTFVGALNGKMFQRFRNLQNLRLSRTNLSNFKFETFYHQTNLELLDLSYNGLKSIDFHLFLQSFQRLKSLNLEGNNLTEIDTITRTTFPKLNSLAISKNQFECEYLAKFLPQWQGYLILVDNPSPNQIHIGGVDCIHGNHSTEIAQNGSDAIIHNKNANSEPNSAAFQNHLNELFAIKILLIVLIIVITIFFVYEKCKRAQKIYKNWRGEEVATESILYSNQERSGLYCEADNNVYNELSIQMN